MSSDNGEGEIGSLFYGFDIRQHDQFCVVDHFFKRLTSRREGGISQVTIWVDGNLLTTLSSPPYQAWRTLLAGEHRFWAEGVNVVGETVKSDVVTITVISE